MYKENSKLLVGGFGRFCFKNITSSARVVHAGVFVHARMCVLAFLSVHARMFLHVHAHFCACAFVCAPVHLWEAIDITDYYQNIKSKKKYEEKMIIPLE